jgi:uncharacterized membrane protein
VIAAAVASGLSKSDKFSAALALGLLSVAFIAVLLVTTRRCNRCFRARPASSSTAATATVTADADAAVATEATKAALDVDAADEHDGVLV